MTDPIIKDLCDTDLYKFSMGQVVFRQLDRIEVVYRYTNRAKRKTYRPGLVSAIQEQIEMMADLRLSDAMFDFFRQRCPWLRLTYLQWLKQYRFKPEQVKVWQEKDELQVEVRGPFFETIYWEVPLLSIITELNSMKPATGRLPEKVCGWAERITAKANAMADAGVNWIDFGTRRRFDFQTEAAVCERMKPFAPHFRGTSNPYLAMLKGLNVFGTYAHELVMVMQALYGLQRSNEMAMRHWVREYRGDLGIALTDTLTTEVFLASFDKFYAKLFDGVRQDSGDPIAMGEKYIAHYQRLGIDPTSKLVVFSDHLDTQKAIAISKHFEGRIKTTMGIGTHLTNDVGHDPPNHVIKLEEADCGHGPVPLVKISDDREKVIGKKQCLLEALKALNLQQPLALDRR